MKLLFAIKSLTVPGGGAERVLVEVVNGLKARGWPVEVLTFDFGGPSYYPLDPSIPRHDMAFNSPGTPLRPVAFLQAVPRIRKAIRSMKPDVVIAFMHSTYVPLAIATSGMKLPLIVSEHTEARHYEGRMMQRWFRQAIDRRSALRTVPSQAAFDGFDSCTAGGTHVVPNPINLGRFRLNASRDGGNHKLILAVGRLMEEKDHSTLLRAFALVMSEFPDWRLRIVGEGPLRPKLEAEAEHLGIAERVEFPGMSRDIASAYGDAAFVVVSSRYESFGMVAAEALASSRAVVGFADCAGLTEIVVDGINGRLVDGDRYPVNRVNNLALGMRCLMRDDALISRFGSAGLNSVQRYGIEPVLDRWEEIFGKLSANIVRR